MHEDHVVQVQIQMHDDWIHYGLKVLLAIHTLLQVYEICLVSA